MNCKRRARIAGLIGIFLIVLPRLVSAWLPGYDYRKSVTLGGLLVPERAIRSSW
ncbi:MAG: hypothetical protein ACUVWX_12080 [Kiritimatiellia bacterium]